MHTDGLIDGYLQSSRLRNLSPGTVRGYGYDLRTYTRYLDGQGIAAPREVRPIHVHRFLESRRVGTSARRRYLASLHSFFRYLATDQDIVVDPTVFIHHVVQSHYLPRPLAPEQIERIFAQVPEGRYHLMLRLMLVTGLRVSEAMAVKIDHLGPTASELHFLRVTASTTRSASSRLPWPSPCSRSSAISSVTDAPATSFDARRLAGPRSP